MQWSEPEPWIIAVLLVTGVAIIGRHPLARAIGTEVDDSAITPSIVASAPPSPVASQSAAAQALTAVPVPTHEPRNPFRALVGASGALVGPQVAGAVSAPSTAGTTTTTTPSHVTKPATPPVAAAAGTCAGTVHTVVAGDTLWSLAARMVKSGDTGRINTVWHRIYKENTPPLGSNPSLLPVGAKLCLPTNV